MDRDHAGAAEIEAYLNFVADKPRTCAATSASGANVVAMTFDEAGAEWMVDTESGSATSPCS